MYTYYIIYPDPKDNQLRVERVEFAKRATARVRSLIESGIDEENILVSEEDGFNNGFTFLNRWED
jgi:hypothetical protein